MSITKACEWCSAEFEARRSSARYCQPAHRTAAHRARKKAGEHVAVEQPESGTAQRPSADLPVSVAAAVAEQLRAAGKDGTAVGRMAILAARRVDHYSAVEPGGALATLMKTAADLLDRALGDADEGEGDLIDKFMRRRSEQLAGGA